MMLEIIMVISPLFTLFISLFPKRTPKLGITFSTDNGQKTKVIRPNSSKWRRFWRSWIPLPTSVGVTVLAVLQWRQIKREGHPAKDWEITCYRAIPSRVLSRMWGWVSNVRLPGALRPYAYGLYSSLYGVNLDEMARDLTYYPTLSKFFTRELKEGVRPIDPSDCIVSPADGRVLNCGQICSCNVEQIKGVTYKIQSFLGEPTWLLQSSGQGDNDNDVPNITTRTTEPDENKNDLIVNKSELKGDNVKTYYDVMWTGKDTFSCYVGPKRQLMNPSEDWGQYKRKLLRNPDNELYQMVVYLAPGDYHRFHSPIHWKVNFRRHFQGDLLSVNPIIAGWVQNLFCLNERVVYTGEWEYGFFSMTAVGATNVGSIRVYSDKSLKTNTRKWNDGMRYRDRQMNVKWSKGEEVGEFRMGSTIVLIFEAPKNYCFNTSPNQRVLVGQSLCCVGCTEHSSKK